MRVYLNDGYWVPVMFDGYDYEPEIGIMLSRAAQELNNLVFLDGGANIGYWSIEALRWINDPSAILAIEASYPVYERLQDNARLNRDRFAVSFGALWNVTGEDLVISGHAKRHGAASVIEGRVHETRANRRDVVRSVTLDDLSVGRRTTQAEIIVKLDVEGAEIAALEGARTLLQERLPLLIYEDHGSDASCEVSAYVLHTLHFNVYYWSPSGMVRIRDVESVRHIKSQSVRGYNFFACARYSSFDPILSSLQRGTGRQGQSSERKDR